MDRWDKLFRVLPTLLLIFFIVRGVAQAIFVQPYLAPDEKFHLDLIELYTINDFPLKPEDYGSVGFAKATDIPFLYHYSMSVVSRAFEFLPIETYIVLRLANVVLSSSTLIIIWKLLQDVSDDIRIVSIGLVVLSVIPSFYSLGAAVNYDNLLILLSTIGVYTYYRFLTYSEVYSLFILFITLILGFLTKYTFVPLGVVLVLLVLYELWEKWSVDRMQGFIATIHWNTLTILLLVVSILLFILAGWWFGNTILQYGSAYPVCTNVLSEARCMNSHLSIQEYYLDAIAQPPQNLRELFVRVVLFLPVWGVRMFDNLFRIGAYRPFPQPGWYMALWLLLSGVYMFFIKRYISFKLWFVKNDALISRFSILVLIYTTILIGIVHIPEVVGDGISLKFHARYLFPIMAPSVVLLFLPLNKLKPLIKRNQKYLFILLIAMMSIDVSRYIVYMPDQWLTTSEQWYGLEDVRSYRDFNYPQHDFFPRSRDYVILLYQQYFDVVDAPPL